MMPNQLNRIHIKEQMHRYHDHIHSYTSNIHQHETKKIVHISRSIIDPSLSLCFIPGCGYRLILLQCHSVHTLFLSPRSRFSDICHAESQSQTYNVPTVMDPEDYRTSRVDTPWTCD